MITNKVSILLGEKKTLNTQIALNDFYKKLSGDEIEVMKKRVRFINSIIFISILAAVCLGVLAVGVLR